MTPKLLFTAFAVLAGVATAVQAAANAGLSQRTGLPAALVVNTTIVLAGALLFFFARDAGGRTRLGGLALVVGGVVLSRS